MMCWNRKIVVGLAVAALAVLLFTPSAFSRALPVLVAAACPLGMLLMARGAAGAACRRKDDVGDPAAGSTSDSAAEIARLRNEVEQLRAGQSRAPGRT